MENAENPQILPVFPELWAAQGLGLINRLLAWPPKLKTSGADDKYCIAFIALGIFFAIVQFLKDIDIEQRFIYNTCIHIYISYLWLLVNLEQLRKGANKSQPVNGR